jgi:hypothetical protein
MIVKFALLLVFISFALFFSVDLLLWLAIPGLPNLLTQLGLLTLMIAFGILLSAGLFIIIKLTLAAFLNYVSARERLERRLLFINAKQAQLKQLFYFKAIQVNYFSELKRKRLLQTNNKQHLESLSKVINKDLQSLKKHLPKPHYLQLHQLYRKSLKQQNIEALLKLQTEIANLI